MESRIFIKMKKRSHWILEGVVDFGLAAQKKRGTESYLGFRFQEGNHAGFSDRKEEKLNLELLRGFEWVISIFLLCN